MASPAYALQNVDADALFSQISLFAQTAPEPAEEVGSGRSSPPRRPRGYDHAILRYIGYYRLVTSHQVLYRFFGYDGKGSRYGFRLLKQMTERGLIEAEPLDPERGAVSRHVLSLTRDGWSMLGVTPPRASRRVNPEQIREHRLQFADVMLEREAEGWKLVPRSHAFAALQVWALRPYRDRALDPTEAMIRERLERATPQPIPLNLLTNPNGEVRLVLPVRRGQSFTRTVESLPDLPLFPSLHFEAVCSEPPLLERAREWIDRQNRQAGKGYQMHALPSFRARAHPAGYEHQGVSLYERNGVLPPCELL